LAAPLATALGMAWGFYVAAALGAAAYLAAAALFHRLRPSPGYREFGGRR